MWLKDQGYRNVKVRVHKMHRSDTMLAGRDTGEVTPITFECVIAITKQKLIFADSPFYSLWFLAADV